MASERLTHKISKNKSGINLFLSFKSVTFPKEYFNYVASSLFSKIFGQEVPSNVREQIFHIEKKHIEQNLNQPEIPDNSDTGNGTHYNLQTIFTELNDTYFEGKLRQPHIQWSLRANKRKMGHFDFHRNRLVISKLLDNPDIPKFVVEGIMYHEMLHIVHDVTHYNGRHVIHSKKFKADEQKFKHHQKLQSWLKKDLPRLIKK